MIVGGRGREEGCLVILGSPIKRKKTVFDLFVGERGRCGEEECIGAEGGA